MRQSYDDTGTSSICFAFVPVMLVAIFGLSLVMLLILPDTAVASQLNRRNQILLLKQPLIATSTTPLPSPTVSSNSTPNSDQQAINTANTFVTFSGVFVAVVAVILGALTLVATIVGILGFFQVSKIRTSLAEVERARGDAKQFLLDTQKSQDEVKQMQTEIEIGVNRLNELRAQFETEIKRTGEFVKGFEEQLRKATQHTEDEIKQLDKRIESESQKFVEAAYYFSEGSKAYRGGDNEHAIELYLRALKWQPNNVYILERLGRAYSNLEDSEKAIKYLNKVVEIDPDHEPALRSLALEYRYREPEKAIEYLKHIVQKNSSAFEAWDFLGLLYRDQLIREHGLIKDQSIIDQAIEAHEKALAIKERPETMFYLAILLLYSSKSDKMRAKQLMTSASKDLTLSEHDQRIRDVWKILMHVGVPIVDGNKNETLEILKSLVITNRRIYNGIITHLRFLLEGTGHSEWESELMSTIRWKES